MNKAYLVFNNKNKEDRQKFVILKTNNSFIFATWPLKQAPQHLDIVNKVINKENSKEITILGGGFLRINNNIITLETNSVSLRYGPIKISWLELMTILKSLTKNQYIVKLSKY